MSEEHVGLVVAVKSHLDNDPRPRPDELIECDQLRESLGVEAFVLVVATSPEPDDWHTWAIRRDGSKIVYREADIRIIEGEEDD